MTEARSYRAGLGGSGEAITIRGDPGPSTRQRELFEAAQLELSERDWAPSEKQIWNEWNINPAKHGPERLNRIPVFVKATSDYDELGRSAIEGAGVEIDQGRRRKGKERAPGAEQGEDVGSWYKALASRSAGASGTSTPKLEVPMPVYVDLTEDDDSAVDPPAAFATELDTTTEGPKQEQLQTNQAASNDVKAGPPLRVHRSEWFIRRALLAQSNTSKTPSTSSSPGPGPSSISTMLNIKNASPRAVPSHYVLGPDNKGYELLRTRHGWEGGGLGRPADWEDRDLKPHTISADTSQIPESTSVIPVQLNNSGEPIVDLTIDSDAEDIEEDFPTAQTQRSGPGRTAPVATSLKLDRLGLGHQRNKRAALDAEKKVTHTIEEIKRVQQRSRFPPPKHGIELGKKGKMKWKERDNREREDRKRTLAMLNS